MTIRVVTDSTSDLSPELVKRFNLEIVPQYVRFGEEVFKDDVDFDQAAFLKKLKSRAGAPKPVRATPQDLLQAFDKVISAGDEVFYIGLGAQFSTNFTAAETAAEQMEHPPLAVINTENLSMGVGLLACRAAELLAEGQSASQVEAVIRAMVPKVRTSFVVETLEYLHKGGRLTAAQAMLGTILDIHPHIEVVDGRLALAEKIRGDRENALFRLIQWAKESMGSMDPHRVSITHVGCDDDAEDLRQRLSRVTDIREIVITRAGSVVSSHCGPGAIGILYIGK